MTVNTKTGAKQPVVPREKQVLLVMKLLRSKEDSVSQVRKRVSKGLSVMARGVEFDISVLKEALSVWDAQNESDHGSEVGKSKGPSKAIRAEAQSTTPTAECLHGKREKRKASTAQDENMDPAAFLPRVARRLSCKPFAPDENADPHGTAPGRPAQQCKNNLAGSEQPARAGTKHAKQISSADRPTTAHIPESSKAASSFPGIPRCAPAQAPSPSSGGTEGLSIKELKLLLAAKGVDCSGCVEKADLEALWGRFEMWRQRPLSELQDYCQIDGGKRFENVEECARYLATCTVSDPGSAVPRRPQASATPPPKPATTPATMPAATSAVHAVSTAEAGVLREQDAHQEVHRILPLRKQSYKTPALWGFAVLGIAVRERDVSTVQRAYRLMMRKLHPDRAGHSMEVAKAMELVREAKEACERGLSKLEPAPPPHCLRVEVLCAQPGRRRFKICWKAPEERTSAPVRRYIIAAFDPAYGRALTITVLEPDYNEELRTFMHIDQLTSYVMAEEDLQKMPKLWTQTTLTVQVAASNEAGQSCWVTLRVPLTGGMASPNLQHSSPLGSPGIEEMDERAFDRQVRKLRGAELRAWLEPQKKGTLAAWLKLVNWSAQGSKFDLIERIVFIREAMPK